MLIFFMATCESILSVTESGDYKKQAHVDRVFRDDTYAIVHCILFEDGVNFGKGHMAQFQSSEGFVGEKIHLEVATSYPGSTRGHKGFSKPVSECSFFFL